MPDQRSSRSLPYQPRRAVEAAILALVLAEDWPWRPAEIAQRLCVPAGLVAVSAATLRADGLVITVPSAGRGEEGLRASWAAVRGSELLRHSGRVCGWPRSNVECCLRSRDAARLLPCRQLKGGNPAPDGR